MAAEAALDGTAWAAWWRFGTSGATWRRFGTSGLTGLPELLNVLGNVFLHAATVPRYAQTPLVEGSYNTFSPFSKTFNHITFEGSYQSSVINIFSHGFYYKCICKLVPQDDIRAYLMLTITYDFMAFISLYLRFRLGTKEPSLLRLTGFRNELHQCVAEFSDHIDIDPDNAQEFITFWEIFKAIIKNASPTPRMPANGRRLRLLARDRAKYHFWSLHLILTYSYSYSYFICFLPFCLLHSSHKYWTEFYVFYIICKLYY